MSRTALKTILTGSILMALGISLGAFGTHGLSGKISAKDLDTFETGVLYHLVHGLAIIAIGILEINYVRSGISWVKGCFVLGILLFSGSIYLLSTRNLTGISAGWIGPITPMGGTLLIAGWIILCASCWKALKRE